MKQKHQILITLLLVSIYCFGLYLSANTLPYSSKQNVIENQENSKYSVAESKGFYAHTQQLENSFFQLLEDYSVDYEFPFDVFGITSYSNKLLFNAKYKQYKNLLENTRIKYRKSDLIFPFHNFW
ncbi:hypothetical protein [Polaribacter sp. Asnod1-A03]|uniref:hypothetical protein n=1 Tax=Polaribacter sp. Asnod1-A03 TaxID=3160581 RepID=UPI0038690794